MKEKIKEIALTAKLGSANFDGGINYYVGTDESFERFADLIIKDVIKQIQEANVNYCCGTTYDKGVADCSKEKITNYIKEYYNIKYTLDDTLIGVTQ
jgi:hypothetical protein